MSARLAALALALALYFAPFAARAEQLLLALSSQRISITSNFTGAELALFGAIERDATTVSRAESYDVVVNVRGPRGQVVVREKSAVGPFWFNTDQRRYIAIPAFIATLSNRPLAQIAGDQMLQKLTLGVDALVPAQGRRTDIFDPDEPNFRQALMRLRRAEGLFVENGQAVTFLSANAFRASIRIPGTAPLGRYDVDVTVLADGVPLTRNSVAFTVFKGGVEQRLATASREHGVLYGLATALMALSLGWLATVIFRRD